MEIKLQDGSAVPLPSDKGAAAAVLADMFRTNGILTDAANDKDVCLDWSDVYANYLAPGIQDSVSVAEIRPLLQSSMEILIREPIEPLMVITGLFTRVMAKGLNTQVLAGAIGAVTAGDIPEHGTYPEVMFQIGGALQTAQIGKSGLAASFTDEALRYSTWDIMSLNLRNMRAALLRHKEEKAVAFLRTLGTTLYDNTSPSTSLYGVTTGRGLDMVQNGSMTMDDLFRGMAHMAEEGFQPDVMLLNPQFFFQFLQDPVLRNLMLASGGGAYFQKWNGQAGPRDPWSNGSMGSQGPSTGNKIVPANSPSGESATGIAGREHGMTASSPLPGYFPFPFSVMVSPSVPYDSEAEVGDIYLLSSGNVGFHLVDEELTQVEWRDEAVDSVKVKLRERYGFAVANEGQGVGIFKDVALARNYWDGGLKVTYDTSAAGGLAAIDPSVPIF
jgi:hypothetical protein